MTSSDAPACEFCSIAAGEADAHRVYEDESTVAFLDINPAVEGFSLIHTSGPLVGTVDHAHVHLLPRQDDDDVSLALPRESLDSEWGERLAERLRNATS